MGGLGTSVMPPPAVIDEVRDGRLTERPPQPEIRKPLYFVWRDGLPTKHPLIAFLRGTAALQ
jgi:DNA-binding transcriptional LysR family regulator